MREMSYNSNGAPGASPLNDLQWQWYMTHLVNPYYVIVQYLIGLFENWVPLPSYTSTLYFILYIFIAISNGNDELAELGCIPGTLSCRPGNKAPQRCQWRPLGSSRKFQRFGHRFQWGADAYNLDLWMLQWCEKGPKVRVTMTVMSKSCRFR